jgi:hypothetical protein
MAKLILAARDGFLDSLVLALAIPAAILSGLGGVIRNFLGVPHGNA